MIRRRIKPGYHVIKETFKEFLADDCPRMAAALAFYAVFSLAPLLVLVVLAVGLVVDPQQAEGQLMEQIRTAFGPETARQTKAMILRASQYKEGGSPVATLLGVAALLFGATGAFAQLQGALNAAWNVKPDPQRGNFWLFLRKRILSLGMVTAVAFLLLVSLVISTILSAVGDKIVSLLPGGIDQFSIVMLDVVLSLGMFTFLFAAMLKVLPDAKVRWRDVILGAVVTSLLFLSGKFLIGFYLGQMDPGDVFGAAGSLAVILIWIYGSAMIFLLGAEFTQVWARRYGREIEPADGARRVARIQ